ncbi:Hypothetical predicted protein [Olea europaea subsp. europaea]|uniref:Uncharacterized protein n=1 Tax=Olea europaea subsp. europaea TaxID=158383 RepID=A0A8S0TDR6_OLEEU|nr:Hypothetical predicted protein [Olea europaea subsp. europaea]
MHVCLSFYSGTMGCKLFNAHVFSSCLFWLHFSDTRIFDNDAFMMNVYQENKDYREFRDKGCREVYSYKVLFGDAYDSDKYTVTPSTMCRTGFSLFEDSRHEDLQDSHPVDEEGSGSSDEGERMDPVASNMDVSRPQSGDKCTHGDKKKKREERKSIRDRFIELCSPCQCCKCKDSS